MSCLYHIPMIHILFVSCTQDTCLVCIVYPRYMSCLYTIYSRYISCLYYVPKIHILFVSCTQDTCLVCIMDPRYIFCLYNILKIHILFISCTQDTYLVCIMYPRYMSCLYHYTCNVALIDLVPTIKAFKTHQAEFR